MAVSPARAAAFDILLRVEQEDSYASELLHSARCADLTVPDHGLTTELVMGVLRWRSVLDTAIAKVSSQSLERLDPEVLTALRLGAYQLGWLDRVPARAAIHEGVELVKRARKRSAASFANAVLRKLSDVRVALGPHTEMVASAAEPDAMATASAHPAWLVRRWVAQFGAEIARSICISDQSVPVTSIRLRATSAEEELRVEGIELVAALVGKGSRILDCCAAPGGKTWAMADRNPEATIVAAELHPHRAELLRRRVPAKNVQVITVDVSELPIGEPFDRILVDVPCSGTGTIARNPEIKWRLKPEDLVDLHSRQMAILQSAMKHVASGGELIYSTCSLEREEDESVIEEVLRSSQGFRLLNIRSKMERLREGGELFANELDSLIHGSYLRTIPGLQPCDGFFVAALQRES
jgi:16S rRNA (cytosine967-C5)-methyltransferase